MGVPLWPRVLLHWPEPTRLHPLTPDLTKHKNLRPSSAVLSTGTAASLAGPVQRLRLGLPEARRDASIHLPTLALRFLYSLEVGKEGNGSRAAFARRDMRTSRRLVGLEQLFIVVLLLAFDPLKQGKLGAALNVLGSG